MRYGMWHTCMQSVVYALMNIQREQQNVQSGAILSNLGSGLLSPETAGIAMQTLFRLQGSKLCILPQMTCNHNEVLGIICASF